jgi:hypothetical protein
MTAFIALLLTMFVAVPGVTGLSVAPVADRTEVVILVDGSITSQHFMMPDGRLVIDLTGVPRASPTSGLLNSRPSVRHSEQ